MSCAAIYFCKAQEKVVQCCDPFAFPVVMTGTLCAVRTQLCDYHINGFQNDGYDIAYTDPEVHGVQAS